MTDERISTPEGWTEADYDSNRPDVRQAKPPAIFEHASGDVAVFVRPADPGSSSQWQVEVAEGGRENLVDAETLDHDIDDRSSGLELAREVMETIEREGLAAVSSTSDSESAPEE